MPATQSDSRWRKSGMLTLLGLGLLWLFAIGIGHVVASILQMMALSELESTARPRWPYLLLIGSVAIAVALLVKSVQGTGLFLRRHSAFPRTFMFGLLIAMCLTVYDALATNLILIGAFGEDTHRSNLTAIGVLLGFFTHVRGSMRIQKTFSG